MRSIAESESKTSFPRPFTYVNKKIRGHLNKWREFIEMASQFLPQVKKQSRRLLLSLFAGIGYTAFGMLEPWPMKLIFDSVFLDKPLPKLFQSLLGPYQNNPLLLLNVFILSIIVIAFFRGICYYYQQILTSRSGQQIVTAIRQDLYRHLQQLSFSFHDRKRTGDMLARLTSDIRVLRELLTSFPLTITSEFLLMIAMLAVMALMDLQLALLALLVVPLLMLLIKKYRFPMKQAIRKQREREGDLTSIASEVLGAIRVVQGFQQEPREVERFGIQNRGSLKTGLKATRLQAKMKWASDLSVALVTAIILTVAGRRVLSGVLSPGDLLVFVFYLKTFNRPLRRVSKMTEQLTRGTASGERILHFFRIKSEVNDLSGVIDAPRFRGHIEFQHVTFQYPNRKRIVLDDVSLTIHPGEKIGIVGKTGSGKSTLVSLLPRFYDTVIGRVLIDGVDIKEYSLKSLREQISFVFQEPVLFSTSIAENIAYGKPEAKIEEIIEACKKANIHEIIESLSEGYETVIGERGCTLSGGQRQCVAIARSMMRNAPIVILDEPTTGLDYRSEKLVMDAIHELIKGKTVIVISHKKQPLTYVDRIIEIKKGSII